MSDSAAGRATRVLLSDGQPALVAALGPDDVDELTGLFERLSDRDRYFRFQSMHPSRLREYVARTLAGEHGEVTLGARVRGELVGAVTLVPLGGDVGEVSAAVDSDWHHHGVGTVLLEELALLAVRAGVLRLVAEMLAENRAMVRVLSDLGLPVQLHRDSSSVRIEVTLHGDERYAASAEDRRRRAAAASLRPVLRPETVVVIGAGRAETSIGRAVLRSLATAGFDGAVMAVNPNAQQIEGVPCWPSVADLPSTIDLAVVTVPAESVSAVVEECGKHGVRAVLLITAGLGRVPDLPARVRELADRYGMRVVGPNTVGVVGPGDRGRLDTTFTAEVAPAGDIGLVAQSGGIAIATVSAWRRLGLGLSAMVAIGDALDVGARDVFAWFDEDPGTALVVLYAESEPDLRGLVRTAAHLSSRVPVLALEPGSSTAGRRAAASHTARAATPQALRQAAYASGGIQSVADLTGMGATIGLLRGQPLPPSSSVAVLTNVGGGGVLAADACVAEGLAVDPFPDDLRDRLRELLPPLATTVNPVDGGAAVSAEDFAAALTCLLEHPAVGAVLTVTAPTAVSDPATGVVVAAAAAAARGCPTPVIDVALVRPTSVERVVLPGAPPGRFLVSVNEPGTAARALAVAARRRAWLSRTPGPPVVPPGVDVRAARAAVTAALARQPAGGWLLPPEVEALCSAGGLRLVPSAWATTAAEAAAAAAGIGGAVAVKGYVSGVVHKGDAGLLRLPVADPAEVGRTVDEWAERAGTSWLGVVVQPMVTPGDELLVGAVRDSSAGPVVAVGPGGRATDALGHRVHRLAPLSAADVEDLLDGTGLFVTGHGAALDRTGIGDCALRVGWLADVLPEVAEIDVNPLVVTEAGALALDVRIRIGPPRP
ncbi:bifunctional GNAT family N-acetyltransferase/acetate--CoA ligase family protein [Blastococcus jejuensis]|uniref:Bifunctional GNAT family N-acetyltransferase/acetate--CoA ligase family protein n=1 Tax=Blastococcus jejuensis TaxID=351224 RepID=A0ABP6NZ55_9ACTN